MVSGGIKGFRPALLSPSPSCYMLSSSDPPIPPPCPSLEGKKSKSSSMKRLLLMLKKHKHLDASLSDEGSIDLDLVSDLVNASRPRRNPSPSVEEVEDVDAPPRFRSNHAPAPPLPNTGADLGDPVEQQVPREPPLPVRPSARSPIRQSRLPVVDSRTDRRKKNQVEYIEVSSTSDEDLANLPLSRGDSIYRGPSSRSRIASMQAARDISPPVTRRAARRMQNQSLASRPVDDGDATPPPSAPIRSPPSRDQSPLVSVVAHSTNRKRDRVIDSSEDDGHTPPSVEHKKQKGNGPRLSDKGNPGALRLLHRFMSPKPASATAPTLQPPAIITSKRSRNIFLDVEAEEHPGSSGSEKDAMSVDKYDSDDSFIDDSEVNKADATSRLPRTPSPDSIAPATGSPTQDREQSSLRKVRGGKSADAVSVSSKASWSKKFKDFMAPRKHASLPETPLSSRTQRMASKDNQDCSATPVEKRRVDKGKGKARRPLSDDEPPVDFGDPDDVNYNSFSEGEMEMLLEGIRRSRAAKAAARASAGESSNSTSPSVLPSTPMGQSSGQATTPPSTQSSSASSATPAGPASSCRCPPLPAVCEVTNAALQDEMLSDTYKNLVALIAGELIPWSELPGPGQAAFSAWLEQCPDMDLNMARNAITFAEDANFINPSRASPENIDVLTQPGTTNRFYLSRQGHPVVALSSVFLEDSQLLTPGVSAVTQKYIRGIFHSQEWERHVAWTCMAFGHKRLHAQLAKDALQFSTRPRFENKEDNKKKRKSMFTNTRSPSTRSGASPNKISADNISLPTDATVPVYDARGTNFNFHTDLPMVGNLPVWTEEIPYGSFVTVAYTLSLYRAKSSKWNVTSNIHWAVIVGVPNDDEY